MAGKWQELVIYGIKEKQVVGVWLVSSLVFMGLVGGVMIPTLSSYWKLRKTEKLLKEKVRVYQTKLNQLSNINESKLQEKVNKGLEVLPLYHNAPLIIGMLSKLSAEHNVRLSSIVFSPGEVASDSVNLKNRKAASKDKKRRLPKKLAVDQLSIRFQVTGSFEGVRSFLLALEQVKPLVRLKKVSFLLEGKERMATGSSTQKSGQQQVVVQTDIEFYAAKLPRSMPGVEDKVYVVPVGLEERYEEIIRTYRGFSRVVTGEVRPRLNRERTTPFYYDK